MNDDEPTLAGHTRRVESIRAEVARVEGVYGGNHWLSRCKDLLAAWDARGLAEPVASELLAWLADKDLAITRLEDEVERLRPRARRWDDLHVPAGTEVAGYTIRRATPARAKR